MQTRKEPEAVGGYEKNLRLVKTYLVQILLLALGYAVYQMSLRIESLHKEMQQVMMQRIIEIENEKTEWRNAYLKSNETYLLTVKKNADAQKNVEPDADK